MTGTRSSPGRPVSGRPLARSRAPRCRTHPVDAALLDRRLEEVQVVGAGVEEQVFRRSFCAEVRVGRDETVERAAAVADDDLQLGEALEHVAVRQDLPGQVLLRDEAELVVVGDVVEAAVEAVGAVDDDRQCRVPGHSA